MKKKKEKYKCRNCGYVIKHLTLGDVRIGCSNCGSRDGFSQHDKKEFDIIMRHLQ